MGGTKHSNKCLETVGWCAARQVQLEPTSKHAWASGGVASSVSKYTGMTQAYREILREEGLLVRSTIFFIFLARKFSS